MISTDPPRDLTARRGFKISLSIAVVIALLGYIFHQIASDAESLERVEFLEYPGQIALHVACLAGMFFFLTLGWFYVLRLHGYSGKARLAVLSYLAPNLGKYIPGKVFMFAGRMELAHQIGVRRGASVSAMIFEHVSLVLAAAPFLALALYSGLEIRSPLVIALIVAMLCFGGIFLARPRWLVNRISWSLKRLGRPPLDVAVSPRQFLVVTGCYLAAWLCYGLAGVALLDVFGIGEAVSPLMIASAFVASWLIGFFALVAPAGLGVREVVLAFLLGSGGEQTVCYALALFARVTWSLVEICAAAVALALLGKQFLRGDSS